MLSQLRADRAAIQSILEIHTSPKYSEGYLGEGRVGVQITYSIYLHILRDALSILQSMIEYLDNLQPDT